jgi:sec-independent protein translocase protein TatA
MERPALAMIFGNLGTTELIVIVVVLLLLFGGKKIPELARGLGKGISEFKAGMREGQNEADATKPRAEAKDVARPPETPDDSRK